MLPLEWFYKKLLKNEYGLYLEYTNRQYGWDGKKLMTPFLKILTVTGLLIFVLLFRVSIKVTEEKIIVRSLFSLTPVETTISDIARVVFYEKVKAPNGDIVKRGHFVIYDTNDGEVWNTDGGFINIDDELIEYILKKNNLKIMYKEIRD